MFITKFNNGTIEKKVKMMNLKKLSSLYMEGTKSKIRIENKLSEEFQLNVGIYQGSTIKYHL